MNLLAVRGSRISRYIQKRMGILCCYEQQGSSCARGRASTLLPLLQRANGNSQQAREYGLGQAGFLSYAGYRRHNGYPAMLTTLNFPNAL